MRAPTLRTPTRMTKKVKLNIFFVWSFCYGNCPHVKASQLGGANLTFVFNFAEVFEQKHFMRVWFVAKQSLRRKYWSQLAKGFCNNSFKPPFISEQFWPDFMFMTDVLMRLKARSLTWFWICSIYVIFTNFVLSRLVHYPHDTNLNTSISFSNLNLSFFPF